MLISIPESTQSIQILCEKRDKILRFATESWKMWHLRQCSREARTTTSKPTPTGERAPRTQWPPLCRL